jgi:hypothetical protein
MVSFRKVQARRGKGDEKSLTLRHHPPSIPPLARGERGGYDPPAENRAH